jgi:Reverse transcriptase (RNA-dependent DNA polymerase)
MINKDGIVAQTLQENANTVQAHFSEEVFGRTSAYDPQALTSLPLLPEVSSLGFPPSRSELDTAINHMASHKAPGKNGIPAEAYKALNEQNRTTIHTLLLKYWTQGEFDSADWHTTMLKLLPKKGNLRLPKNWRPIALLDVLSKILSSIIARRLDRHAQTVGLPEQSGFSSHRNTSDSTFALKVALQARKALNRASHVVFVDIVKAFDSVNREMLWLVLSKYGVPWTLIAVIKKMYAHSQIESRVNGIKICFDSLSGVKQGDNLAPVLFLFAIQAALNQMDAEWDTAKTELTMSDKMTTRPTRKTLPTMTFSRSLFADDSAFLFTHREDAIQGMRTVVRCFANFGLQVHLGNGTDRSKTEAMFFPAPLSTQSTKHCETTAFDVLPGKSVSYCERFTYLGSLLTPDLSDKAEITRRIGLAQGQLKRNEPILRNKTVKLQVRVNMYMAFVVNTLLFGCDTWTIGCQDYARLSSFHTKACRKLLHINMQQVKTYRITNQTVLERVNLPTMTQIIQARQIRFLERITLMDDTRLPRMMVGAHATRFDGEVARRGNYGTTRSTLRSTLEAAGLSTPGSSGDITEWIPKLKNPAFFPTIAEKLGLAATSFPSHHRRLATGTYSSTQPSAHNQS